MSGRRALFYVLLISAVAVLGRVLLVNPSEVDRCSRYQRTDQPLIAHAGGGLPMAVYTNSLEALETSAGHGFKLIEIDFWRTPNGVVIGHSPDRLSALTFDQLLDFLRRHPEVSIVTDFKTTNILGLTRIAELAGPMKNRFVPQIYSLDEFEQAKALGFPAPILTAYRSWTFAWVFQVNKVPVRAVTMPYSQRWLAGMIEHPVYLHTVNVPTPGYGLYTDCLIPARAAT